jgi:hypothetical protein
MTPLVLYGLKEDLTVFGPIESGGTWEPHLIAVLRRIIRPDFVCRDVGANIGAITLVLSRLARDGAVCPLLRGVCRNGLSFAPECEGECTFKCDSY